MGLLDIAKADAQKFTSNTAEFGVQIRFDSNDSPPATATVGGTSTKHHLAVNREGAPYKGKVASVTVAEGLLTAAGYPVRNARNEVDLKGHKVTWTDSTGTSVTYTIDSWVPDERLGLIVCILGNYKNT